MGEEKEEEEGKDNSLKSHASRKMHYAPGYIGKPPAVRNTMDKIVRDGAIVMDSDDMFTSDRSAISAGEFVNASGSMIGGTISVLDNLRATLQAAEKNTLAVIESNIDKKLSQDLKPIQTDLESTKKQVEEARESLTTLGRFIDSNKASFVSLISVEGKMGGFESQMSSIQNRVEKLEAEKNIKWNKTTMIISLGIAAIGMCCGIVGTIAAVFSYFK